MQAIEAFVKEQLAQGIRSQCRCGFNASDFVSPRLRCNPESPMSPTFRAAVVDLASTSASSAVPSQALLNHAQTWIKSNPTITSGLAVISVDPNCPISPGSFNDRLCSDTSSGISVTVLVGALVVEFIVLCIVGFVAFTIFVAVVSSRQRIRRQQQRKKKCENLYNIP